MKIAVMSCIAGGVLFAFLATLYFVVDSRVQKVAFGYSSDYGTLTPVGVILCSFILELLTTIFGAVSLCVIATGKKTVALRIVRASLSCSLGAYCYFIPFTISDDYGDVVEFHTYMEWGPGMNIGATVLFFLAYVLTRAMPADSAGGVEISDIRIMGQQ